MLLISDTAWGLSPIVLRLLLCGVLVWLLYLWYRLFRRYTARMEVTFKGSPGATIPSGTLLETDDRVVWWVTKAGTVDPSGQVKVLVRRRFP